ncbi:MAG: type II toxin-antitoxin system PemK/MazF family toxin [Gemmatimonadetes bacterium]|nr:type II toxin-antitoxin system PemK/MazF family toxin [Gemmatimonadota bacterium]
MVAVAQGDVWWAELPDPVGSGPGFRRPVVVVQGNSLNRSKLPTVVCIPLTSNLTWAEAPGNTPLSAKSTGLPKASVANATLILALDRAVLTERAGKLTAKQVEQILQEVDVVLGR